MELAKTYTPKEIESKWYKFWETSGYFKPTFKDGAPNYCIQLPPPNVTGTLHMGHGFQQTLMDILIRYHRMNGYNTLWQVGTDHAGIATQIVVERQLEAKGVSRHDLGREEFIRRVWEWKKESGSTITSQMRRLGASCDWSREQFTMNDDLSTAVNEVFVGLYEKGYIYRGKRLVNWDIKLQTAVSDLEVVSIEENGSLWHIRYPVKDSQDSLVIATTRPETMLGDVAVAVNPKDARYKHLIGQKLILPLVEREIPIIADECVDIEFGTGCVKITPAHDFNDYETGKRHNLEMINIMTLDGHINDNSPLEYRGMERFLARKKIVTDLKEKGFLVEVKPHKLVVPRGDRTNVVIEPMLTDQWFMRMDELAKNGLDIVSASRVSFVPDNWTNLYNQWLENVKDWCISRQLWWGHRIPAYYDESGNVFVARNKDDAIAIAKTDKLTQDEDVLDTWFSSALWCFSTLGWPDNSKELAAFLPSSVLVTGFDIIFFWVARMIMLTNEFTGKVPFKEVYITGLILDAHGQKMSKSKGNTIDPLDLLDGISLEGLVSKRTQNLINPKQAEQIAKITRKDYPDGFQAFGSDALRFAFALLATNGREIRFDLRRIESARHFCNKLWNATRFVLMNLENQANSEVTQVGCVNSDTQLSMIDSWILLSLERLISEVNLAYKTYRFDLASQKLYEFVWNEFCDWYLELAKVNFANKDEVLSATTMNVLLMVLEGILRLLHPFMPFITEELWQVVANICGKKQTESIMITTYPNTSEFSFAQQSNVIENVDKLKELVAIIRNLRAEMNLNPGFKVPLIVEGLANDKLLLEIMPYVKSLAKISQVEFVNQLDESSTSPIAIFGKNRFMLKVEIDVAVEKTRLNKEIEKVIKERDKIKAKLETPGFIERAPKEMVARETGREAELEQILNGLHTQLNKLNQGN